MSEKIMNLQTEARADLTYLKNEIFSAELLAKISELKEGATKEERQILLQQLNSEYKVGVKHLQQSIKEENKLINDHFQILKEEAKQTSLTNVQQIEENYKNLSLEERNLAPSINQYKNALKGEKTVLQRAILKLDNENDRLVLLNKQRRANSQMIKAELAAEIKDKSVSVFDNLANSFLLMTASFNLKKTLTTRKTWLNLLPTLMLIILFVAHVIVCEITGYKLDLDSIITYGIYIAVVAVGAVFIYAQGAFDMSLGASTLITAAVTGLVFNATGNIFLALVLAVALGMILGTINSLLAIS